MVTQEWVGGGEGFKYVMVTQEYAKEIKEGKG